MRGSCECEGGVSESDGTCQCEGRVSVRVV